METLNLHPAYVSSRDISGNNAVRSFFFSLHSLSPGKEEGGETRANINNKMSPSLNMIK